MFVIGLKNKESMIYICTKECSLALKKKEALLFASVYETGNMVGTERK
jgi:hypothetical protein